MDHLGHLTALQDRFADTIAEVPPRVPVPWCGRWRVRDLVVHLARGHHWVGGAGSGSA